MPGMCCLLLAVASELSLAIQGSAERLSLSLQDQCLAALMVRPLLSPLVPPSPHRERELWESFLVPRMWPVLCLLCSLCALPCMHRLAPSPGQLRVLPHVPLGPSPLFLAPLSSYWVGHPVLCPHTALWLHHTPLPCLHVTWGLLGRGPGATPEMDSFCLG